MKNLISSFIEAIPDKSMRVLVACLVCGLFGLCSVVSVMYFKANSKSDIQYEYDKNIKSELRAEIRAKDRENRECEERRLIEVKLALIEAVKDKKFADSVYNAVKNKYK